MIDVGLVITLNDQPTARECYTGLIVWYLHKVFMSDTGDVYLYIAVYISAVLNQAYVIPQNIRSKRKHHRM